MRHATSSSDPNVDWLPYNGPWIVQNNDWFIFTLKSYSPAKIVVAYSTDQESMYLLHGAL